MTIYALKPRFQALLRPLVRRLAAAGGTANGVTLLAMVMSIVTGCALVLIEDPAVWLALPAVLFARMALNAIDGMLAREFDQQSRLGALLNELGDVVSDAALYLPFAFLPHFHWFPVALVVWLSAVSEAAGLLGPAVGAERRYDGPLGKSDRAFVLGALGLAIGLGLPPAGWLDALFPLLALLLAVTTINRCRQALRSGAAV